jgi:hypothetical protein
MAGKFPPETLIVLAVVVGIAAVWIYAATRSHTADLELNFTVYTDAASSPSIPQECQRYAGLPVVIKNGDTGEELWRGQTQAFATGIRTPALGCAMGAHVAAIPEVPHYRVTILGMGEHVYSLSALKDYYNIIVWDDVCLQDPQPCEVQEVFYDS